jgi:SNF2 family DNA or RNA helicase
MMLKRWSENGGVMIMSQVLLTLLGKEKANVAFLHEPGPDVIVIDEAHAMLKQNKSVTFQALAKVNTFRRILLTGSPFQNSLKEYFRMVTYTRPGLLGASESIFESDFISPIMNGTASNATPAQKAEADRKLVEIRAKLAPYVNRRDATELLKDLPPLQQVVLYVRPTKLQNKLYRAYKGHREESSAPKNFFRQLHDMRPVNNHPACLLSSRGNEFGKSSEKAAKKLKSANSVPMETSTSSALVTVKEELTTSVVGQSIELLAQSRNGFREKVVIDLVDDEDEILDEDERSDSGPSGWWQDVANEIGSDKFNAPTGSNKVVMLFHILALASKLDEKVIVFSQCLKVCLFFLGYC